MVNEVEVISVSSGSVSSDASAWFSDDNSVSSQEEEYVAHPTKLTIRGTVTCPS